MVSYNFKEYAENNLINNNNILRAHRTYSDPISIFQYGLFMGSNMIDSTSCYLSKESLDSLYQQLSNWTHGKGKYFIIIEIPRELYSRDKKDDIIAFTKEKNSFSAGSEMGTAFKLPSKYIKGALNVETNEFVENPMFAFSLNNPNRDNEIEQALIEMNNICIYDEDGTLTIVNEKSHTR